MKWYKLLITGLVIIIAVIIYLFANISVSEEVNVITIDLTPKFSHNKELIPKRVITLDEEEKERTKLIIKVTGYAPLDNKSGICADSNPTSTSVGHYPSREYAAADPKKLAYGTKLDVPGYGVVEIGDTGGAMRQYDGYQVDLFFDTYDEAIEWGVQYLEVEVLE